MINCCRPDEVDAAAEVVQAAGFRTAGSGLASGEGYLLTGEHAPHDRDGLTHAGQRMTGRGAVQALDDLRAAYAEAEQEPADSQVRSVIAVCAIVTGERVRTWITPEPSSMDSSGRRGIPAAKARPPPRPRPPSRCPGRAARLRRRTRGSPPGRGLDGRRGAHRRAHPSAHHRAHPVAPLCPFGQLLEGGQVVLDSGLQLPSRTKTIFCSLSGIASTHYARLRRPAARREPHCGSRLNRVQRAG